MTSSAAASTSPLVALVGNPNCGKTALFNLLTGSRQKIANYAGVTVERKEGTLHTSGGQSVRVLDLPGFLQSQSQQHRRTGGVRCAVRSTRRRARARPAGRCGRCDATCDSICDSYWA